MVNNTEHAYYSIRYKISWVYIFAVQAQSANTANIFIPSKYTRYTVQVKAVVYYIVDPSLWNLSAVVFPLISMAFVLQKMTADYNTYM